MASENFRRLLQAKFKNIAFYIRSESVDGEGQKRIIHDYPSSNTRFAEAQGQSVPEFSLDVFFTGPNYQDNYKAFKAACQDPTPGTLFMPVFGIFYNMVALPFSSSSNQTDIGEIKVSVKFTQTIERPSPLQVVGTEEDVATFADVSIYGSETVVKGYRQRTNDLRSSFLKFYASPLTLLNIASTISDLQNCGNEIQRITGFVTGSFNKLVISSVKSPSQLAELLFSPAGLFRSIGEQSITTWENLCFIGSTIPADVYTATIKKIIPQSSTVTPQVTSVKQDTSVKLWNTDTKDRVNRNTLRLSVINTMRVFGLINLMQTATEQNYTTDQEVISIRTKINNIYDTLVTNDTTGVVIPEVAATLAQLLSLTYQVLATKEQNAFAVTSVNVESYTSCPLLVYQLYGERLVNEDQLEYLSDIIAGLNSSLPRHALIGEVKVVEIG